MNVHLMALQALMACDVAAKLDATRQLHADWQAGTVRPAACAPAEPILSAGRPGRPRLAPPEDMPRRELNSPEGHAALIHALAHIEFNAINLALDAVYRCRGLPGDFYADWLRVADEEAYHFALLDAHLRDLGRAYGDFPAHDGLWDLARKTDHDLLARMALVPRLMEARGLDVTPGIQKKLRGHGDQAGSDILDIILRDEIGHVAAGDHWFRWECARRGLAAEPTYLHLVTTGDVPKPRGPFNRDARIAAGFSQEELAVLERGVASGKGRPGRGS